MKRRIREEEARKDSQRIEWMKGNEIKGDKRKERAKRTV